MTLACSEVLFSLCICLVSWQLLELYEDMNYFRYAQPQLFVCECLLKLMNAPASAKLRKSREGRSTSGLAIIEWDIKSSRLLGCIQIITESNTPCLFVKFHKLPNPGLAQAADCGGVTESEVMMIWSQAWVSLLSVLDNVVTRSTPLQWPGDATLQSTCWDHEERAQSFWTWVGRTWSQVPSDVFSGIMLIMMQCYIA